MQTLSPTLQDHFQDITQKIPELQAAPGPKPKRPRQAHLWRLWDGSAFGHTRHPVTRLEWICRQSKAAKEETGSPSPAKRKRPDTKQAAEAASPAEPTSPSSMASLPAQPQVVSPTTGPSGNAQQAATAAAVAATALGQSAGASSSFEARDLRQVGESAQTLMAGNNPLAVTAAAVTAAAAQPDIDEEDDYDA